MSEDFINHVHIYIDGAELAREVISRAIYEMRRKSMSESKERYTPGGRQVHHSGGHAWQITAPAKNDQRVAIVTTTEHDARLIVEAPNMFQLLKQGLAVDADDPSYTCPCQLCVASRAIIQRVLEG